MEQLTKGRRCTGTVTGYTSGGHGVLRVASPGEWRGAVVFVPGAVRGETVEAVVTRTSKTAAVGELVRVLEPSLWRRTPDCPLYGQCGGCAFRHVTYEEELRAKRRRVEDALQRTGGAEISVEEILPAAHPLRYRNKAQFPVGADGAVGFYRARSHRVVPAGDCLLLPEAVNRTAAAVRGWITRYNVPPYDERTGKGLVRHIFVRINRTGESLCCIVANGRKLPKEPELAGQVRAAAPGTAGVLLNTRTDRGNVVLGERYRVIWGQDFLPDTLCGLKFRLSVPSFYQINREQAEALYSKVLEYAALTGTETVLDLYCGIGTITLCLARRARQAIGAEIVPEAVSDAVENAARNGIQNVRFLRADAAETAVRLAREGLRPDVVTVDPPRKGLSPEVIDAIAVMKARRVVYVSCDPGTLGRDVKRFSEAGYRTERAAAVDMFPGTRHVESVVFLSQQKPDDRC